MYVELHDQNQEDNSEKLLPHCLLKLRSQKGVLPKHKSQVMYIALQGRGNLLQCSVVHIHIPPPVKRTYYKMVFFEREG
jgi:hypothetical protein